MLHYTSFLVNKEYKYVIEGDYQFNKKKTIKTEFHLHSPFSPLFF